MKDAFHKPTEEELKTLRVSSKSGLSSDDVKPNFEKYGPNERSLYRLIMEQLEDLLVRILVLATSFAILYHLEGRDRISAYIIACVEPFVILFILIANTVVGIWQIVYKERGGSDKIEPTIGRRDEQESGDGVFAKSHFGGVSDENDVQDQGSEEEQTDVAHLAPPQLRLTVDDVTTASSLQRHSDESEVETDVSR